MIQNSALLVKCSCFKRFSKRHFQLHAHNRAFVQINKQNVNKIWESPGSTADASNPTSSGSASNGYAATKRTRKKSLNLPPTTKEVVGSSNKSPPRRRRMSTDFSRPRRDSYNNGEENGYEAKTAYMFKALQVSE